jgi:F-type H+-transporting ATPase subunit delta
MKVSTTKYAQALTEVLKDEKDAKEVNQKIQNLLKLLTKRKQGNLIKELPEAFKKAWLSQKGQLEVNVTLPYKPTDQDKLKIVRLLTEALNKEVIISIEVDEEIIGGMKIEFGDYIIDGTVIKNLELLKSSIANK